VVHQTDSVGTRPNHPFADAWVGGRGDPFDADLTSG
jgi:hypothetical protein